MSEEELKLIQSKVTGDTTPFVGGVDPMTGKQDTRLLEAMQIMQQLANEGVNVRFGRIEIKPEINKDRK